MIPGHSALGGIEDALGQLRSAEADANRRLDEAMRKMAEARTDEAEGYRDLAAFRLKSADGLGGQLTTIATKVRAVLALRANDRTTLDKKLAAAEADIARIAAERQAFAAELAEAEEKRRAVENEAQVGLAAQGDYAAAKAAAEQAVNVAKASESKAKVAEDELEAKRKPYEDDALFTYLWRRGYGTQDYQAGNIARLLDGWVARIIRYQDARPNYAMLTEIPRRLREHANRSAALAVEAVERIKTMETNAFTAGGGDKANAEIEDHRRRLEALDATRASADKTQAAIAGEIEAFGRGEDQRYREAVGLLAEALRATDLNRLYQEARATPSPDDERIVQTISAARDAQDRLDDMVKRVRGELAEISRRRSELSQVATGFRNRRYDTDGSYFDNDVIGHLLRGLVTGALSGADYWARMEQGRRWSQPFPTGSSGGGGWWGDSGGSWGGSWSGGGSWGGGSSSGGSWGGGGSSGGGSWGGGSSGGRDDDGFSTKGGF